MLARSGPVERVFEFGGGGGGGVGGKREHVSASHQGKSSENASLQSFEIFSKSSEMAGNASKIVKNVINNALSVQTGLL